MSVHACMAAFLTIPYILAKSISREVHGYSTLNFDEEV